jgi:chemotaxis protein CheD
MLAGSAVLDPGPAAASETVYLAPGQLVVTPEPCLLTTVLGSCVAVVLHDPVRRIAGMNHFLLPGTGESRSGSYRYAEPSLDRLAHELELLGCRVSELRAGVFGGARVLVGISDLLHLGESNVEASFAWLRARAIPVFARDVLGDRARRLKFNVADGTTGVRLLGAY